MDAVTPKHLLGISGAGWRPPRCRRVALVLQGGGALGAYQAGVYQALHEADVQPDWISGVSIGAINAALIAGNPPELRMERLAAFWDSVTARRVWAFTPDGDMFRQMRNAASSMMSAVLGQPGFFNPRFPGPLFSAPGAEAATSYYDTAPLRETLCKLVDFELLNSSDIHFSVGAVNVATGNFVYFNNTNEKIGPEHILASGALPPAFPSVKIGNEHYWDGGIVSNTPLQYLLDHEDGLNALVFQVDLFNARGSLPGDISEVQARLKDILYSSRTRYNTDVFRRVHAWKARLREAFLKMPKELMSDEDRRLFEELEHQPEMTILQLIYQQKEYEGHSKDFEFSGTSMREHWESGYEDTKRTLRHKDWMVIPPPGGGIVTHDVHNEFHR
ncbi:MAG: patatin-like phospholipase family protein [Alphaproteobacteria bacterium]|nr:patatin-like phospholipase family protein [Alphaproteobacteria bacterium]